MYLYRLLLILCGGLLLVQPVHAATKALIVASDYSEARDKRLLLANPVADARMVDAAFRRTAIDEVELVVEPDAEEWEAAFETFANSLSGDDIALFYFAGHGFQIDGANYFLASDGQSLIALDPLVRRLTQNARGAVVIVDACRNNPLIDDEAAEMMRVVTIEGGVRALETVTMDDLVFSRQGLAQLANLRGLSAVVFFSTEPGNVAEDGATPGKGSPFAKEFVQQIKRRQSLDETFRKTAVEVNKRTDGRQSPWRQGDLSFDVFFAGMRALPIP